MKKKKDWYLPLVEQCKKCQKTILEITGETEAVDITGLCELGSEMRDWYSDYLDNLGVKYKDTETITEMYIMQILTGALATVGLELESPRGIMATAMGDVCGNELINVLEHAIKTAEDLKKNPL